MQPVESIRIDHGLQNRKVETKNSKTKPYAPPDLFELHTLAAFIGARGSGKTNACVLLAKQYYDSRSFNRIFIISPTFESNPVFSVLPILDEDVYKDGLQAQQALMNILDKIKHDVNDYERSQQYVKVYKKHQRGENLSVDEDALLSVMQHEPPEPLEKPSPLIIIDDMSHSNIYSTSTRNPFINLCLRHRHVHGVGVTLFMLVQTFRSGIPRGLRQNVQLWFIWKTQDRQQMDAMYDEFASLVTKPQFDSLYDYATHNPHDFLTVDLNGPPEGRFRKNFDEILVVR